MTETLKREDQIIVAERKAEKKQTAGGNPEDRYFRDVCVCARASVRRGFAFGLDRVLHTHETDKFGTSEGSLGWCLGV